jgi:hypothetical protein
LFFKDTKKLVGYVWFIRLLTMRELSLLLVVRLLVPTARAPAVTPLPLSRVILGGRGQTPNEFALFMIQVLPCFQSALAATWATNI